MALPATLHRLAVLPACLLLLCVPSALAGGPVRETVDGVVHVRNGAEPSGGVTAYTLKELWTVGGEDDEAILFGLIPKVCVNKAGDVFVLDSQLNQVLVFSPDGELVRTLFREGEGPGEVREPRDMFVLDDGRVGVIQEFPGALILVDRDGLPAGRMQIGGTDGGIFSLTGCEARGDFIVMSGTTQTPGDTPGTSNRIYFLSTFGADGRESRRYCEHRAIYDFNNFVFSEREHIPTFWYCFAAGADGRMVVAPDRDRYLIDVFGADGELEMVIERDFRPLDLSDQEYGETRQIYETALTSLPVDYTLITERQAPAIPHLQRGIRLRDDGTIWALSGRGIRNLPEGILAIWDVFSPDGDFVRQVELRGPGDSRKDGIFFAGRDRVIVVKGYLESLAAQFGQGTTASEDDLDAESFLSVTCYELVD